MNKKQKLDASTAMVQSGLYQMDEDSAKVSTSFRLITCGVMALTCVFTVINLMVCFFFASLLNTWEYFWVLFTLNESLYVIVTAYLVGFPVSWTMIRGGTDMLDSIVDVHVLRARLLADVVEARIDTHEESTRLIPIKHSDNAVMVREDSPLERASRYDPSALHNVILPNGREILEKDFIDFLQQCLEGKKGFAREIWTGAGNPLSRQDYDGMMSFLVTYGIIVNRADGQTGDCKYTTAKEVCDKLGWRWD